jgi:EAL domain-containing protein (putative c-di-GMP-specific phosphodiesterase class I)
MGAGQAQGYYFAKPMGLEALLASSLMRSSSLALADDSTIAP